MHYDDTSNSGQPQKQTVVSCRVKLMQQQLKTKQNKQVAGYSNCGM
ncbi:hypothetical protein LINPERPRIM_LOCUS24255 [Linum perenne]